MAQWNMIDIKGVKEFAMSLPPSSSLREVILSEPDKIPALEFLGKSEVWLKLAGKEPAWRKV